MSALRIPGLFTDFSCPGVSSENPLGKAGTPYHDAPEWNSTPFRAAPGLQTNVMMLYAYDQEAGIICERENESDHDTKFPN